MDSPPSPMRRSRASRIFSRTVVALVLLLTVLVAFLVLGAFVPAIPYLGVIGSTLTGVAGWVGLMSALLLIAAIILVIRRRSVTRTIIAGVAAVALMGSVAITTQLIAVGRDAGVSVSAFQGFPSTRAADATVEYGKFDDKPLELSIWEPDTTTAGRAPVAIYAHGGGWSSGDASVDLAGMPSLLADRGWLVVSVEYTLATEVRPTAGIAEAQMGCAMAWAGQNASRYGGDTRTMITMGESAGGNLAINGAYRVDSGDLTCDSIGPIPEVGAVVAMFPAVDPYALHDDGVGKEIIERYIGGSPEEHPELYEAVASATHIRDDSPPTLIMQGENDHLVDADSVYSFVDRATASGMEIKLIKIPFAEHGFIALPMGTQLYTGVTLAWLDEHGSTP